MPSLPGFTFSGPTIERGWHPRRIAAALRRGDGRAWLRAVRAAGRRLGFAGLGQPRGPASRTGRRAAPEHGHGGHAGGGRGGDRRGEPSRSSGEGLAPYRRRLPGDPGNPAAVARLRARGLARRARRVGSSRSSGSGATATSTTAFAFDRLLDNITAYWVTGTATSSLRIYWEMRQARRGRGIRSGGWRCRPRSRVPGRDVLPAPVVDRGRVQRGALVDAGSKGGHFAAMEAPDAFVEDVRGSSPNSARFELA